MYWVTLVQLNVPCTYVRYGKYTSSGIYCRSGMNMICYTLIKHGYSACIIRTGIYWGLFTGITEGQAQVITSQRKCGIWFLILALDTCFWHNTSESIWVKSWKLRRRLVIKPKNMTQEQRCWTKFSQTSVGAALLHSWVITSHRKLCFTITARGDFQ